MRITLLEQKCQSCGVRLTKFEIEEKDLHCMECFADEKLNRNLK